MPKYSDETPDERVMRREIKIAIWERRTAAPLAALALLFMGLWAYQVLGNLSVVQWDIVEAASITIWVIFLIDFSYRLVYHYDKKQFLRSNVIEILALLLPAFRFLRMFRVITALGFLARVMQNQQGRIAIYLSVMMPMLLIGGAIGVLEAEHGAAGANILTFRDAIWWAGVTLFTVGFGDNYPVTDEGRIIAFVLMLSGWALLSVMTAAFASYFARQAALTASKGAKKHR
ncbi:MAG: hypothetical protein RL556_342 [Actinomycetota bacterium]